MDNRGDIVGGLAEALLTQPSGAWGVTRAEVTVAAGDERVAWQHDDCPRWCVVSHAADDHPHDRRHVSVQHPVAVTALANAPVGSGAVRDAWSSEDFVICLQRRDGAARTSVYIGDGTDQRIELELASMRELFEQVGALISSPDG